MCFSLRNIITVTVNMRVKLQHTLNRRGTSTQPDSGFNLRMLSAVAKPGVVDTGRAREGSERASGDPMSNMLHFLCLLFHDAL